jgi:hypothetical protein
MQMDLDLFQTFKEHSKGNKEEEKELVTKTKKDKIDQDK